MLPARAARRFGAREALIFEGRRWSFEEFDRDVDRAARGFLAAGVAPGEKLSLWLPDRPTWLHAFFGALKIGAVVLPLNTRLRTHDLEYAPNASDSTTLLLAERADPIDFLGMAFELEPGIRDGPLVPYPNRRCPALRRVIVDESAGAAGAPGGRIPDDCERKGPAFPAS